MADYLLDTNMLKYWYDRHPKVLAKINLIRRPDPTTNYTSRMYISVITLGEIEYGHRVTLTPDPAKQAAYTTFVQEQCPEPMEMSRHIAEHYGRLKAWLFNNCAPIGKRSKAKRAEELLNPSTGMELGVDENDLWIAAQAWTHNFVLVTNDSRGNFGKVVQQFATDFVVENWTI